MNLNLPLISTIIGLGDGWNFVVLARCLVWPAELGIVSK